MEPEPLPSLLDAAATGRRLPFGALVDALARAAEELADGRIRCPPRMVLPLPEDGLLLSMPAVADDLASHKLISVTPGNAARGLPTIRGHVAVLDPRTGATRLLLDGPTVTGRRTAAMSMLGLRLLWPQGPRRVLLVGTGVQARHHVQALAALHPGLVPAVRGSAPARAAAFCETLPGVRPEREGEDFDVVIACTSSRTPVLVQPASAARLLIATGAFQADTAEVAAATVRASRVYVDDPAGAAHEAGDILLSGLPWAEVRPIAQALRQPPPVGQPLLFKTVGCAAWDLAAARVAAAA